MCRLIAIVFNFYISVSILLGYYIQSYGEYFEIDTYLIIPWIASALLLAERSESAERKKKFEGENKHVTKQTDMIANIIVGLDFIVAFAFTFTYKQIFTGITLIAIGFFSLFARDFISNSLGQFNLKLGELIRLFLNTTMTVSTASALLAWLFVEDLCTGTLDSICMMIISVILIDSLYIIIKKIYTKADKSSSVIKYNTTILYFFITGRIIPVIYILLYGFTDEESVITTLVVVICTLIFSMISAIESISALKRVGVLAGKVFDFSTPEWIKILDGVEVNETNDKGEE